RSGRGVAQCVQCAQRRQPAQRGAVRALAVGSKTKSRDRNPRPGWAVPPEAQAENAGHADRFARPEMLRDSDAAREWQFELSMALATTRFVMGSRPKIRAMASM